MPAPSSSPVTAAAPWQQLPSYPQPLGVAGILAGEHHGVLIAAGGANFPGLPPWEGGKKVYYDELYVLLPGAAEWKAAGRLPERRGYSAVLSLPEGVLVVGGENAEQVFGDSLWLRWNGEKVVVSPGPKLPAPTTSPVAVRLGESVYVAAGYAEGTPRLSRAGFWRLDLTHVAAGWTELPFWPGTSRGQAVMAAANGAIYLFSGLEMTPDEGGKAKAAYLSDAYRYRVGSGWEKLGDMPRSAIAAPTPAPVSADGKRIYILGGVDGRLVGKQPRATRVPDGILSFDVATGQWQDVPEKWPDPVVTTPAVKLHDRWVFVSGETMAAVRTPHVWSWAIPRETASTTSAGAVTP